MIPLLRDILYPNEKEMLAEKYRIALIRIGETTKQMKPKPKAMILNAIRQSGFAKENSTSFAKRGCQKCFYYAFRCRK